MMAFLFFGLLTKIKIEFLLLLICVLIASIALFFGELYLIHISSIPRVVFEEIFTSTKVLFALSVCICVAVSKLYFAQKFMRDKWFSVFTTLIPLMGVTSILVVLSNVDLGTAIISLTVFFTCAFATVYHVRKSLIPPNMDFLEDQQSNLVRLLWFVVRLTIIFISIVLFFYLFKRLNGEHIVLAYIRSWPFAVYWLVLGLLAMVSMFAIRFQWIGIALLVHPFLNPITNLIEHSHVWFDGYALILLAILISSTLGITLVLKKKFLVVL